MRTRQTFRRQMGGRCYVYVGDNSDPGKPAAEELQGGNRLTDSAVMPLAGARERSCRHRQSYATRSGIEKDSGSGLGSGTTTPAGRSNHIFLVMTTMDT